MPKNLPNFSSLHWKLDNSFYHSRRREMRLNSSGGKEISAHQNTTYWTDLFVRHFLFQTDYEADRDDLLFFIRKTGQTLFFVEIEILFSNFSCMFLNPNNTFQFEF